MQRHAFPSGDRQGQRGGIALLFVLLLIPLMAFMGLALDMGRIYVNKTEAQNAADACALAAAMHLTDTTPSAAAYTSATNSGKWVAGLNAVDLQAANVPGNSVTVAFSNSLSSGSWRTAATGPTNGSRLARCSILITNRRAWFLRLVGVFNVFQTNAQATATIPTGAGFTNCGFAAGNCTQAPSLVF